MVDSDDSDSSVRGMLLEILIERHRLLNDLLVQLRGVEQVEPVLLPDSKAQMGNVETWLFAGDGNDVAIVDCFAHRLCILHLRLGDETKLLSADTCLGLSYFRHKFRVRLQSLVALGVLTHIADIDGLYRRKGRIRLLNLADDASLLIRDNPIGEIMDAGGIAINDAIIIAHIAEVVLEGRKSELLLVSAERKGCDVFYQSGAIELAHIEDQLLLIVDFEGMGHIGHIEEFTGKEQREAGIGFLFSGVFEQALDEDAIIRLFTGRYIGKISNYFFDRLSNRLGSWFFCMCLSLGATIGARLQRPHERANGKGDEDM